MIAASRRRRRADTDRFDGEALVRTLLGALGKYVAAGVVIEGAAMKLA